MRSWPEPRQLGRSALVACVVALGIVAESQGFTWGDTRSWVPDLLVGWTLAGLGVAALGYSRDAGVLLVAAGIAWFVGDFHASGPHWTALLASRFSWVFLAPLVQLALAYPSGRPRTLVALGACVATWFAVLTPWVDWNDDTTLAAAMAVLALAGLVELGRASAGSRRDSLSGLGALLLLLVWALVVPEVQRSVRPIAFDAGVAATGVWLFVRLRRPARVAERAIELDESNRTLRAALAQLLHDPALEVGFASGAGGFVDEAGHPVEIAPAGRVRTEIFQRERLVGVVVHDARVLAAQQDREAIAVAMALGAARARLRSELRRRAGEVSRSTVSLIRAEDDERLRLAAKLEVGTSRNLREAGERLEEARLAAAGAPDLDAAIAQASDQLERTRTELAALAGGLGVPALVAGLPSALGELVHRLPLEVETDIADVDCASEIAATLWFVCSEGVTNVLKHAGASHLRVELAERVADVRLLVEDDGRGGADASGSGLAGLHDRVAALGGSLTVEAVPAGGTRLEALLPRAGGAA
jgi:signal transduction histidine kinase